MLHNVSKPYPIAPFIHASLRGVYQDGVLLVLLAIQIIIMGMVKDFSGIMVIFCTAFGVYAASIVTNNSSDKRFTVHPHILITGILTGFFLPNDIGFFFSFIIAFISYFLTCGIFGGKGGSWINPVMLAVCIASVSKPEFFTDIIMQQHIIKHGSAFQALTESGFTRIPADQSITSMLNTSFLHRAGVTLPEGYMTMLISFPSKIPAFRYNIITIMSSILLLSIKGIQKSLVFTFLAVFGSLVYFFPIVQSIPGYAQGDILYAWFTSGAIFAAFFIINDTGTLPRSSEGRFLSGIALGICAFFVAKPGVSQAGIPLRFFQLIV